MNSFILATKQAVVNDKHLPNVSSISHIFSYIHVIQEDIGRSIKLYVFRSLRLSSSNFSYLLFLLLGTYKLKSFLWHRLINENVKVWEFCKTNKCFIRFWARVLNPNIWFLDWLGLGLLPLFVINAIWRAKYVLNCSKKVTFDCFILPYKHNQSRWERRKPLGMFCMGIWIRNIMTIPLFAEG